MALTAGPVRLAARVGAELGEGPVWDAARAWLWFVDIKKRQLHRHVPGSTTVESWAAPAEIGWALPADNGRLLCGLQDGLYWFEPETGTFSFRRAVEPDAPGNRLNDGTTDAAGCVWFGSMDNGERDATGRFYRLVGEDLGAVGPGPVAITNGPAVSPCGTLVYFTDTLGRRIWRAAVSADGDVGPAEPFVTFAPDAGYPDGPVCDSAGNVWTGMFAGGGVRCFAPDGRERGFVAIPAANVTKIAFGGPQLTTAYVTTATKGLSADARAEQPNAGDLFAFDVVTPGVATTPCRA